MIALAIAFSCGPIILYCFGLTPAPYSALAAMLLVIPFFRYQLARVIAATVFGYFIASLHGAYYLQQRLPAELAGDDYILSGYVCSLARIHEHSVSVDFCSVKGRSVADYDSLNTVSLAKIRLYWSDYQADTTLLKAFSNKLRGALTISARLDVLSGTVNFHAASAETRWFANGYLARASLNAVLHENECNTPCRYHRFRASLVEYFQAADGFSEMSSALFQSLVLGNRLSLDASTRQLFIDTGTIHVLVVSGLHISLVGMMAYVLLRALIRAVRGARYRANHAFRRESDFIERRIFSTPLWLALITVLVTLAYALIAGFSLPVQRAFLMFAIAATASLGFHQPLFKTVWVALAITLFFNPASALLPGFYLSYFAVFSLLLLAGSTQQPMVRSWLGHVLAMRSHGLVFLSLLPVLAVVGMPASPISILANLLIVPVVGLVLLPLGFTVVLVSVVTPQFSGLCVLAFDMVCQCLLGILEILVPRNRAAPLKFIAPDAGALCLITLVIALLLPLATRLRVVITLIILLRILPVQFPGKTNNLAYTGSDLTLFDVGQGLSLQLRYQDFLMMYDFGYGTAHGYDSGKNIILPELRAMNRQRLALAVVSHWDIDHSGGWQAVSQTTVVDAVLVGEVKSEVKNQGRRVALCAEHYDWKTNIDDLEIKVLWPRSSSTHDVELHGNNGSCVLKVKAGDITILMPGDIERKVELELVKHYGSTLQADILIVPHHGSATSSSWALLKHVRPSLALVSSGYRNVFRHPADEVLNRLAYFGAKVINTADAGAISVSLTGEPTNAIRLAREQRQGFWLRKAEGGVP